MGLRQAARQLGHWDALKATFAQRGLPALERRLGCQPIHCRAHVKGPLVAAGDAAG
jgi:hypothetical protein